MEEQYAVEKVEEITDAEFHQLAGQMGSRPKIVTLEDALSAVWEQTPGAAAARFTAGILKIPRTVRIKRESTIMQVAIFFFCENHNNGYYCWDNDNNLLLLWKVNEEFTACTLNNFLPVLENLWEQRIWDIAFGILYTVFVFPVMG